jgi:5-methyltetrahydrofolate--homocysteine methyltransferase
MPSIVEAGASFVGGCCGTTPEFIRALASKI